MSRHKFFQKTNNKYIFLSWRPRNTWNLKLKFKFQVYLSRQDRKTNLFVHFLGEVTTRQFRFQIYWPLNIKENLISRSLGLKSVWTHYVILALATRRLAIFSSPRLEIPIKKDVRAHGLTSLSGAYRDTMIGISSVTNKKNFDRISEKLWMPFKLQYHMIWE